jgi:hypothetical protein
LQLLTAVDYTDAKLMLIDLMSRLFLLVAYFLELLMEAPKQQLTLLIMLMLRPCCLT